MDNMEQPISLFKTWFDKELRLTKVQIPTAVCLSTIGIDNFPNARYVSLKDIIDDAFIITGPIESRKGIEIHNNSKVALTFWWTETKRQIRVQGIASEISEKRAENYFLERNIYSKAVAQVCEQGKVTSDIQLLEEKVKEKVNENRLINKPESWGGFSIKPLRIEFMEFKRTRFHDRKLYEFKNEIWHVKQLQP